MNFVRDCVCLDLLHDKMMTKDEIILEIQRKFKNACPSGILLEWDRNRFYDLLLPLFVGYKVKNQTDFNYSYCNSFDIVFILQ